MYEKCIMRAISALKQQKKSQWDKQTYLNIKYLHPAEGRKKQLKSNKLEKYIFSILQLGSNHIFSI